MIPLQLTIKNFVSYGPQTQIIDFGPYNLICLSGKNGHGKSALLDALTWTIWGEARKMGGTPKADEGLLRLGQTHMCLTLDFQAQGTLYRIKREYTYHNNKSQSNLEFGIIDPTTQTIKSLTDKTIKSTQKQIEAHIGLDYDCFINSAFIRQGHSNEFSKKSPRERKDILATILGLNQYETLKKQASEKAKEYIQEKNALSLFVERLKEDLVQKIAIKENLDLLKQKLNMILTQEQNYKDQLFKIKQLSLSLSEQLSLYEKLKLCHDQLLQEQKKYTEFFYESVKTFRDILKKSRTIGNYKQVNSDLILIEEKIYQANKDTQEKILLQEQLFALKQQEDNYKHKLQSENQKECESLKSLQSQTTEKVKILNQSLEEYKFLYQQNQQELSKLEAKINFLKRESTTLKNSFNLEFLKEQFEKRKQYYNTYQTTIKHLQEDLKSNIQKVNLITNNTKAACPLCHQTLPQEHKHTLSNRLNDQVNFSSHRLKRLTEVTEKLKTVLINQHEELQCALKNQETAATYQAQCTELVNQQEKITQHNQTLEQKITQTSYTLEQEKQNYKSIQANLKQAQDHINTALLKDVYIKNLHIQQEDINGKIQSLYYTQEYYEKLREEKHHLLKEQEKFKLLNHELALQEQRKKNITEYRLKIKNIKHELKAIKEQLDAYKTLEEQKQTIAQKEEYYTNLLIEQTQEKEILLQNKGALEEQYKTILLKDEEYNKHQATIKRLTEEIEDYQAISNALSKDGIQALLIEQALPEIEQEANSLLARLTDNQAHLIIDSLKDLKSGRTRETLDIKISDSMGIRAYELFSGGEAFRIDFALRIAISKLLARRAGASLQTLIIDEGFGSQDEEGLSRIMECIHKIQDDFAKVIVVSHLTDLKEQFPIQFLVNKGPQGTTLKVVEQG